MKNFKKFMLKEQNASIEDELGLVNKGIEEIEQYEEMNPDPKDVLFMILNVKSNDKVPPALRDHLVRSMHLMSNKEFRSAQKESLLYLKNALESGKHIKDVVDIDEEFKEITKRVTDLTTKILQVDFEDFVKGTKKFFKGAIKYGDIRREEASRVVSTPEDPYGEENWENALSEEDAMRQAFDQVDDEDVGDDGSGLPFISKSI